MVLSLSRAFVAGCVASLMMVVAFAAAFVATLIFGGLPLPIVGARGILVGPGGRYRPRPADALVPQLTGSHALGLNPLALGLATALIGASFGALVGSLQAS